MKRFHVVATLLLAGLVVSLVLLPACVPSSLSCDSSAAPTPRPTGPVRADFYAPETELNGKGRVAFFNAATGPVKEWSWDFNGDGVTDITGPEVSWYFNDNGYYAVTLRVDGWDGSTDTLTKEDYIYVYGCGT